MTMMMIKVIVMIIQRRKWIYCVVVHIRHSAISTLKTPSFNHQNRPKGGCAVQGSHKVDIVSHSYLQNTSVLVDFMKKKWVHFMKFRCDSVFFSLLLSISTRGLTYDKFHEKCALFLKITLFYTLQFCLLIKFPTSDMSFYKTPFL